MLDFRPERTYEGIAEKLAVTTDPRHRRMLEQYYKHARGEVVGDLDAVISTLSPNPVYKYVVPGDEQPSGLEGIRQFYRDDVFATGRNFIEQTLTRIVVDDHTIVAEGPMRLLRWGRDLVDEGATVDDPEAVYLIGADMIIVWPFDDEQRIIGEETWAQRPTFAKVDPADVPDYFAAYIAGKRQRLAA